MQLTLNPNTAKSLRKAEAMKACFALAAAAEAGELTGLPDSVDADTLKRLAVTFAPSPPAKPKDAFDFVRRAVSTDEARYNLTYVRATGSEIMATDAHRLHRAPSDLPEGFYCPKTGAKVDDDVEFPGIEKVWTPEIEAATPRPIPTERETYLEPYDPKRLTRVNLGQGLWVNLSYLQVFEAAGATHYRQAEAGAHPVLIETPLGRGMIMPVRVDR